MLYHLNYAPSPKPMHSLFRELVMEEQIKLKVTRGREIIIITLIINKIRQNNRGN
jgi:hypothetical protein